jgi:hypothetical protein
MFLDKAKDWRFYSSTFCLDDLWQWESCSKLLDVFEGVARPEFWGEGDVISGDYDRPAIRRYFEENSDPERGRSAIKLKRSSPPRFIANVNVGNPIHPHSVHLDSEHRHEAGEIEQLFLLADALASRMSIDFATIDINREGQDRKTRMLTSGTTTNLEPYISFGPGMIWVRNYFGPRLVRLGGGAAAFTRSGGFWRTLEDGTISLDVVERPWTASPEALKEAQNVVLRNLIRNTGIFHREPDDENAAYPPEPGPKWEAPPGARWPSG